MVAQGFFAGAVAKAIGAFCELDESLVESRLLNKSRISLKDLRLKPQVIKQNDDFTVELHGKIKSAVFQWKWSSKGLLKKCTFTLSGLRVTLKPVSGIPYQNNEKSSNREKESEEGKKGKKNWKDKILLKILDQLYVKIEDVQIIVEAPRNAMEENMPWKRQLMVFGKDLELESLGRIYPKPFLNGRAFRRKNAAFAPLLQQLKIGSLSSKVIIIHKDGNAELLPLIHPFQYHARVKRVDGKRFASFSMGLEVEGMKLSSIQSLPFPSLVQSGSLGAYESIMTGAERVEVYADEDEIETSLCNFQTLNMAQSVSWEFSNTYNNIESRDDTVEVENNEDREPTDELFFVLQNDQIMCLFSVLSMLSGEKNENKESEDNDVRGSTNVLMRPGSLVKLSKISPANFSKSSRAIVKASKFDLPFPAIHLELPNGASLTASDCNLKLRLDNSLFQIVGTGEVFLDNECALPVDTTWTVDMKKKEIILKTSSDTLTPHHNWDWNFHHDEEQTQTPIEVEFKKVRQIGAGFAQLLQTRKLVQRKSSSTSLSDNYGAAPSSHRWSVMIEGNSRLVF